MWVVQLSFLFSISTPHPPTPFPKGRGDFLNAVLERLNGKPKNGWGHFRDIFQTFPSQHSRAVDVFAMRSRKSYRIFFPLCQQKKGRRFFVDDLFSKKTSKTQVFALLVFCGKKPL